jgi:hypothetical protein
MDIKYACILIVSIQLFQGCGECKPDKYGEFLQLVVPVTTSPAKDTFSLGDTLTIEANFSKEIEVYNTDYTIYLDSFKFFTDFGISEISGTYENYAVNIDTIVEIGQVGFVPLHDNVIAYPLKYQEDDEGYQLKFKIVLNAKGMFWVFFSCGLFYYEPGAYDHPALYACDKNRRDQVIVYFKNNSTSLETYESMFLKTKVDYLLQSCDYETYSNLGSISIIVK